MSGYLKKAVVFSGILLMIAASGCNNCPLCKMLAGEAPITAVEAPPEPAYVEAPAPPPEPPVVVEAPPPPPPVELPPVVTKAIEELSDKYPGLFTLDKANGLLRFNSDLMFDSGSAVVKPEAKAALGKLASILNEDEVKDRRLTIVGHTDSTRVVKRATISTLQKLGKSADNMGLSEARSEAAAAVLQAGGIDASRMTTVGKGESEPAADNRTPGGKARNRRVEIYLTAAKPGL